MPYDSTVLTPSSLESVPPPPLPDTSPQPIAPVAHTIAIFALLVLSTWYTSTHAAARTLSEGTRVMHYLGSIGLEWILLGLVMLGIYRRRDFLRMSFRNRSQSLLQSIGVGFAVYLIGLMSIAMVSSILYFTPRSFNIATKR